ncbi:DEgenerin Like [Caenorhabditis elegans]|uniref:DEgenerin Like n=3 Tax=Caenorhabditis elegans TaxID=6239 RepID=Q7YTI3_CAEEL|nr:DEgenerin Like [Caenorhabditis elegans]CAE18027.1 DEgenerin Like [Caenorhabditis elegans]|eukprot:NP_001255829.1 Uncharacterized protein CELE_Y57G11C.44 [Caenorhabditis elegans]
MSEVRQRKSSIIDSDLDFSDSDGEFKEIIKDIENDQWKDKPVDETRWSKTKSAVHEWGLSCSWHGIPHMAQSLSWPTILLWTTLLIISAVLFVYLITVTVRQYFSFQKLVNLNIGMVESNFPSITFCNTNPYKLSAVRAIPELEALLTVYSQAYT